MLQYAQLNTCNAVVAFHPPMKLETDFPTSVNLLTCKKGFTLVHSWSFRKTISRELEVFETAQAANEFVSSRLRTSKDLKFQNK